MVNRLEVFEAIQKRYSVRLYLKKKVPSNLISKVLEAARLAPSASNRQPWHFIVVTDEEKKKKIAQSGRWAGFIDEAPAVIVALGDHDTSPKWYPVDVTIAMEHIVLEATELGLGTCWVGSFKENLLKDLLKIPAKYRVVAILSIGYPSEEVNQDSKVARFVNQRKKFKEIVSFNEYGKSMTYRTTL